MSARFLAFDLGAESGRAILGRFQGGVLRLTDVCRFANEPVNNNGSLRWDILRLWLEIRRGLESVGDATLDSIGLDTWGCDYALLGEKGQLLENPYHYRDIRTDGIMEIIFREVSREKIYAATGIQFININTLVQLYAASRSTPRLLAAAESMVMIPDLLNYWLTGRLCSEYTIATTSQLIDPNTRAWATVLMDELGLPSRLVLPLVEPGALLGGVRRDASTALADTPVVAPACHDTGSAFAAMWAGSETAFLSSGTWSLLGAEVAAPIVTSRARDLNFTNEGGVCGTTRLLKNIGGMWLLESCRRSWADAGQKFSYEDLLTAASDGRHRFHSLFDPDNRAFFNPPDMPRAIAEYCRQTGQPEPSGPPGYTRAILESLAFKYRVVLESLEELTGTQYRQIQIVGGGSRNRLLNQFTADVTGRTVIAGPTEATALGNLAIQMLATGTVTSLAEARAVIERSFPVERFEPVEADRWDAQYRRFQQYVETAIV